MRNGRLAAAGVIPPDAHAGVWVKQLRDSAETVASGPGPTPAASAEESEQILRWLEQPGVRLVHVEGEWVCPVRGATRHLAVHDAVEHLAGVAGPVRRAPVTWRRCTSPEVTGRGAGVAYGYLDPMITAIVFVKADVARIPEVAEAIAAIDGVSEVYSVTGQIDLIALVRVKDHDDVARVIADSVNKVSGVMETETHIAFRTYSKHDLESAFSLGLD